MSSTGHFGVSSMLVSESSELSALLKINVRQYDGKTSLRSLARCRIKLIPLHHAYPAQVTAPVQPSCGVPCLWLFIRRRPDDPYAVHRRERDATAERAHLNGQWCGDADYGASPGCS